MLQRRGVKGTNQLPIKDGHICTQRDVWSEHTFPSNVDPGAPPHHPPTTPTNVEDVIHELITHPTGVLLGFERLDSTNRALQANTHKQGELREKRRRIEEELTAIATEQATNALKRQSLSNGRINITSDLLTSALASAVVLFPQNEGGGHSLEGGKL
ncbi:hypothetical protein B484DRAFT_257929 [Ochromonadaceae sp. CCMP2298]|nr:hypothetical protein B484DRAFT_257929 [Ochromonadaceae sp. CCMP2298]